MNVTRFLMHAQTASRIAPTVSKHGALRPQCPHTQQDSYIPWTIVMNDGQRFAVCALSLSNWGNRTRPGFGSLCSPAGKEEFGTDCDMICRLRSETGQAVHMCMSTGCEIRVLFPCLRSLWCQLVTPAVRC